MAGMKLDFVAQLPSHDFKPIKEDCIRRDLSHKCRQLYFWKKKDLGNGKLLLNLSQTVATPNSANNSSSLRTVLQRKLIGVAAFLVNVALDEVDGRLYVQFGKANEDLIRRIDFLKLKVYGLTFDSADPMGYRPISLTEAVGLKPLYHFCCAKVFGVVQLFLDSFTGTLMFQAAVQDRFTLQTIHRIGWSAVDGKSDKIFPLFTSSFNPGHREPISRCMVRKGQRLLVGFKPLPHDNMVGFDQHGNVDPDFDELMWGCSGGFALFELNRAGNLGRPTLTLKKTWFPDLKPFLKVLIPTNRHLQSLATLCQGENSGELLKYLVKCQGKNSGELLKYLGKSSAHMGSIFKYHLFTFPLADSTVVAIKNLESFIAGKISAITTCRILDLSDVILVSGMQHSPDVQKMVPCPYVKWIVGTRFMVEIAMYDTKTGRGPAVLYQAELSGVLKDYRTCANCSKIESKKLRLKNGKRGSSYKVCRECKARSFHLDWRKYPCHYCSLECMEAHWTKHKEQHKLKAIEKPGN